MSTGAEKILASVIDGDGADVPIADDEIGRITLPLAGSITDADADAQALAGYFGSVTDADAQALAGYAHIIGATAGILLDPHTTIIDKELARELIRTCTSGITAIVENGGDEEQTT